jgi:hypothetical protein
MLLGSGRELASRFQELGSHLLKVLHFFISTVVCSVSDSTPKASSAGDRCQEAEAVKTTKEVPAVYGMRRDGGASGGSQEIHTGSEPNIVFGPAGLGVTPTQERDKGQGAGLRSLSLL